jgi:hypothetical protein
MTSEEVRADELVRARDEAIKTIPSFLRHPIYLPTERIPVTEQIAGIKAIANLYAGEMDVIHRPALRQLKAGQIRKRCFVIGNGPSLLKTDLSKLAGEVTFVMNGFFLKMPELDWVPTYYVCEDHLVAEDRALEINSLKGPTKLFPASLRYVIQPDEYTVFYDHRPRKSYPHGFDFSFDADVNTYTGGTVTFSCLQLAAYMGFEEIYLIGVDASYAIPEDAKLGGAGRIKELDMESDDPNHFHPDYFGKGKRWHEPNVHTMIEAYKEARRACDARGVAIYNATVGGKLEVFTRVDYSDLFPPPAEELPKVLLLDLTRNGDGTATGELKSSLFADWPKDRIFQVYGGSQPNLGTLINGSIGSTNVTVSANRLNLKLLINKFDPDVIVYRPVPNTPHLHELAMELISESDKPLVSWIMDDWPASLEKRDRRQHAVLEPDLRSLLRQSAGALSIGPAMSAAFEDRYGQEFAAFANGVERKDWNWGSSALQRDSVVVRYSGSLAEDMGLESLLAVASAVEVVAEEGVNIAFEIKTRKFWADKAGSRFKPLKRTRISTEELSAADYRKWLSDADVVLICYNFDEMSKTYVRYSVANKLPECLASGAALLAVGPSDIAMLQLLRSLDCSVNVETLDPDVLKRELRELATTRERRAGLVNRARVVALNQFDMRLTRQKFVNWLERAVQYGRSNRLLRVLRSTEGRLWALQQQEFARIARPESGAPVEVATVLPSATRPVPADTGAAGTANLEQLGKKFGGIATSLRARFAQKVS